MTERNDFRPQDAAGGADIPRGSNEEATAAGGGVDASVPDGTGADEGASAVPTDSERQLDDQRDRYLRLAAEYDNFRKRATKERLEAGQRAQAELVRQLVDALDDLARFAHVDPATVEAATVVQGAEMVEKKLLKALQASGLQLIHPLDQPFDPSQHEAVMTEPALSAEDDHLVARVFQSGYMYGSQLLRPARVVVRQWNG